MMIFFPQPPTVCISGTSQAKGGVCYSTPERIFFFFPVNPSNLCHDLRKPMYLCA